MSPEAAMLRMADLCMRSEQCEADIRQKLYKYGLTAVEVQQVVSKLLEQGFIDNGRYAGSFARDKCRFTGWGRNKIRLALVAKRIPSNLINEALASIDPAVYEATLRRVTAAKARGLDLTGEQSREQRLRLFRHLLIRGFESELASRAIREYIENHH